MLACAVNRYDPEHGEGLVTAKNENFWEGKMATQRIPKLAKLTEEQTKEGYSVEQSGNNVLVWHKNNQIALLCCSSGINKKVREVVEGKRKKLKEVDEKTGWKPD